MCVLQFLKSKTSYLGFLCENYLHCTILSVSEPQQYICIPFHSDQSGSTLRAMYAHSPVYHFSWEWWGRCGVQPWVRLAREFYRQTVSTKRCSSVGKRYFKTTFCKKRLSSFGSTRKLNFSSLQIMFWSLKRWDWVQVRTCWAIQGHLPSCP